MLTHYPSNLGRVVFLGLLFCFSFAAHAQIKAQSPQHFSLNYTIIIDAPLDKVESTLINVSSWWSAAHTYSGDANNLYIDLEQQLCFCEKLDRQGVVKHMGVGLYWPGKQLRLLGGLGPLQALPVNGSMNFQLTAVSPKQTKLEVNYLVSSGTAELSNWAKTVDNVLTTQLKRLKIEVEK
ncbi:hypothetical protein ACUR5C_03680 [Aliikangiella sp. IMCC44653]